MLTIKNVKNIGTSLEELSLESEESHVLDVKGRLTVLPALIEPSGGSGLRDIHLLIGGGVSSIFESSSRPSPLHHYSYLGASAETEQQIYAAKNGVLGVRIVSSSDSAHFDRIFQLCGQKQIIVSLYLDRPDKIMHETLRLAEKYKTELLIFGVSTQEELETIQLAKKRQMLVFCGICTERLFSEDSSSLALWEGIHNGSIDIIGGNALTLPLLLNAYNQGKITLKKIIDLTRKNCEVIFNLPRTEDLVLVDLSLRKAIPPLFGMASLEGWPIYTIISGKVYPTEQTNAQIIL